VALIRRGGITEPRRICDFYLDILLQGDVRPAVRSKLVAFLERGKPTEDARDQRVREMIHAIMTTPEYQLA
jgi:archaellum component FlaD/FlaE